MYTSQVEYEKHLNERCSAKGLFIIQRNEEEGRADSNTYAKAIYRRFMFDLADLIRTRQEKRGPGQHHAHLALLRQIDSEVAAMLGITYALQGAVSMSLARDVAMEIGKNIMGEVLLKQFEDLAPDLYHVITEDLKRRMSRNERHRLTLFKIQAKRHGFDLDGWTTETKLQVGMLLLDMLVELGMLQILGLPTQKKGKQHMLSLTEDIADLKDELVSIAAQHALIRGPFIQPPQDWVAVNDGGYHTPAMRKRAPWAIRARGEMRGYYLEHPEACSPLLATLNILQQVPWKINQEIMRVAASLYEEGIATEEVPRRKDDDKPVCPLPPDWEKETGTPQEREVFRAWKREMAMWYTELKRRGSRYSRFAGAMRDAREFQEYPEIFFRYTADFRGRVYAESTGVSPQGSDLQKALIHFAEGKPLDTPEAVRWFMINGANRYGYDKASLDDRVRWVRNNEDLILRLADDPITYRDWLQADAPFQFLAWALEYRDFIRSPVGFVSRVPVGMDGSCNGLQNYSAMLRDEVGGRATNLLDLPERQDIYEVVAKRAWELLAASPADPEGFRERWLIHGGNRKITKRITMTLPYGAKPHSCMRFIFEEYVKPGKAPEFSPEEYTAAAAFISKFVWSAIEDVVIKAREAMDWLQRSARTILKSGVTTLEWTTPMGTRVSQAYIEQDSVRVVCRLGKQVALRVMRDKTEETPDINAHANGIAPNMIHSVDASHMSLVVRRCASEGITSLAMIHDDFGTTAADAARLYTIIREEFVQMHESFNPIQAFYEEYKLFGIEHPPMMGGLDIRAVLDSEYFFC